MENLPKSEILKSDISDMFSSYLKDLTQSCESEIEKQLLLCFVKYIFKDIYFSGPYTIYAGIQNARDFNDWKFTSISQIYDCQERIHMSIDKLNELKSKGYKEYTSDLVKSVGIILKMSMIFQIHIVSINLCRSIISNWRNFIDSILHF